MKREHGGWAWMAGLGLAAVWAWAGAGAVTGVQAADGWAAPAAERVLYETGFEPFEGFDVDFDLGGQSGWVALGSGGNGLLPGPIEGFRGQVAYVGFTPPAATNDLLNLFRPVALVPVGNDLPLITFTVSFQIFDSTTSAPQFDDFRWSAYNTREERLFTLDFDNEALEVNFALDDGKGFRSTGFRFRANEPYDLRITLNFARNLWTADINGAVLVNAQPITTKGLKLDLNEIDAVWAIRTLGKPGDNFMIFDDYRLVALPVSEIPPTLELVGRLTTGPVIVRVLGEPGVRYALESSVDLKRWEAVGEGVAQSPGGVIDLQDAAANRGNQRFYRAYSVR
jgi:hypothetical protein